MGEKRKRGRPKKDNSRKYEYLVLMTEGKKERLEALSYLNEMPKSEILRRSVLLFDAIYGGSSGEDG